MDGEHKPCFSSGGRMGWEGCRLWKVPMASGDARKEIMALSGRTK